MQQVHRIKVSFQFLRLSVTEVAQLRDLYKFVEANPRSPSEGGGFLASIELIETEDYSWIQSFLKRNQVQKQDCRIFVSLNFEGDKAKVRLPNVATNLMRILDCEVDLSFTSL